MTCATLHNAARSADARGGGNFRETFSRREKKKKCAREPCEISVSNHRESGARPDVSEISRLHLSAAGHGIPEPVRTHARVDATPSRGVVDEITRPLAYFLRTLHNERLRPKKIEKETQCVRAPRASRVPHAKSHGC